MDASKLVVARIADIAGSWLAIVVAAVILIDDSLFGVHSATEPRVIEAAIGVAAGVVGCLGISFIVGNFPRFSYMFKTMAVITLSALTVAGKLVPFSTFILVRFGILIIAALLAWIDTARTRCYEGLNNADNRTRGSHLRVAFVLVALLAGGSLWQQRENFYIWSPFLEAVLSGITGVVAVVASVVLFSIESSTGNYEAAVAVSAVETGTDRPLGTALLLSLFFGISCGLYMSLSMLVAQNTAIEYPSSFVYAINAGIATLVVVITLVIEYRPRVDGYKQASRAYIDGPGGLVLLLVVTVTTVGLPYMFATNGVVDFTTAGTFHITGLVSVPLLGFFMLSRLACIKKTGGYAALVGSFCGLGLVIGIAGYLVGGNTYNMDFYVGLAYTILLALGVLTAWFYKPRVVEDDRIELSRPSNSVSGMPI